jgi:hypothetical protein
MFFGGAKRVFLRVFVSQKVHVTINSAARNRYLRCVKTETEMCFNVSRSASSTNDSSAQNNHTDVNLEMIRKVRSYLGDLNSEYSDRDCERYLVPQKMNAHKAAASMKKRYEWYNTPVTTWKIANPSLTPREMGTTPTDDKEEWWSRCVPRAMIGSDREGRPIYWEKSGVG